MTKKFHYFFCILFFTCCQFSSVAQSEKIDSLLNTLKTAKDTQKVNILNALAQEYEDADVDISFKYSHEGLKLAESIHFKKGAAKSSTIIGSIYESQNKPKEALEQFLYALEKQKELNNQNEMAKAAVNAGIAYAELGLLDSARVYMLNSLTIDKEINNKDGVANVLMNLGGTYDVEQKWNEALDYYNQSLKLRTELAGEKDIAKCLTNIGYIYFEKGDYENSKKNVFESIDIEKRVREGKVLKENYDMLRNIFVKEKQFEKAFQYQELFTQLKDSLAHEASVKQFMELEEKYQSGKKQKEIELLNKEKETQALLSKAENERKNNIIIFICIGLALIIVFTGLLFNRFRVINKQKKIIEEKNKDITDSITYAKRIQSSLLPTVKYIEKSMNRLRKD